MSKTFCTHKKELKAKARGKKNQYICSGCGQESPKEKWCCKPKKIKR